MKKRRLRSRRRLSLSHSRSAHGGQSCDQPYRAGAQRALLILQDAHLEQRWRRSRKLRQCDPLRRAADRGHADRQRWRADRWKARALASKSKCRRQSLDSAGTRSRSPPYPMDTTALPMAWDASSEHPMARQYRGKPPPRLLRARMPTEVPLEESWAHRIEEDPAFPERINVNVGNTCRQSVEIADFRAGRRRDALACGTGACASAIAAIATRRVEVACDGRHVAECAASDYQLGARQNPIRMRGAATHVFERRARPRGVVSEHRNDRHSRLPAQFRREATIIARSAPAG